MVTGRSEGRGSGLLKWCDPNHAFKDEPFTTSVINLARQNYTGDELWLADETNGTMEMEVTEPMRGWPHLKVGSKIKGIVRSIRDS